MNARSPLSPGRLPLFRRVTAGSSSVRATVRETVHAIRKQASQFAKTGAEFGHYQALKNLVAGLNSESASPLVSGLSDEHYRQTLQANLFYMNREIEAPLRDTPGLIVQLQEGSLHMDAGGDILSHRLQGSDSQDPETEAGSVHIPFVAGQAGRAFLKPPAKLNAIHRQAVTGLARALTANHVAEVLMQRNTRGNWYPQHLMPVIETAIRNLQQQSSDPASIAYQTLRSLNGRFELTERSEGSKDADGLDVLFRIQWSGAKIDSIEFRPDPTTPAIGPEDLRKATQALEQNFNEAVQELNKERKTVLAFAETGAGSANMDDFGPEAALIPVRQSEPPSLLQSLLQSIREGLSDIYRSIAERWSARFRRAPEPLPISPPAVKPPEQTTTVIGDNHWTVRGQDRYLTVRSLLNPIYVTNRDLSLDPKAMPLVNHLVISGSETGIFEIKPLGELAIQVGRRGNVIHPTGQLITPGELIFVGDHFSFIFKGQAPAGRHPSFLS